MHRKTVRSTAFNTKVCSDARSVGAHRASVGIRFDGGEWTDLGALRSNADGVFPLPIEDIGRMTLARTAPNEPISATLRFSWPEEVARVPKPHIDTTPADSLLVVPDAWKAWQCAALTAPEVAIPDPAASKWLAIAQVHDASCPAGAAVARSKACAFVPDAIAEIQRARTLVSLQVISARFEPNVLYGACETDQQRMLEQTLREAYGSLAAAESPTHVQLSALDAMSASALAAGTAVVNDREVAWAGLLERASAQKASLAEPLRAWSEGLRGPLSEDSDAGKAWRSAMKAIGTSTAAQDPRPVQKALTARAPWLGNAFVQAWVGSAVAAAGAGEWSTLRTVEGVLADAALLESIKLTDADRSRLSKQALDMRKTQLARGCAAPDGSASGHDTRAECLKWMWQEMHKRHDRDAPPVAGVMEKVMDAVVSAESKRDAAQAREYAELREIGRALRDSGVFGCDSKKAMCNENCKFAMNIPGDPFAGMRCYADCMDENGCRP
jgi:hypothetical protein